MTALPPSGSFRPKHFNEGVRSEAWLDAEIPLPSLYSPRPEESLTPAVPTATQVQTQSHAPKAPALPRTPGSDGGHAQIQLPPGYSPALNQLRTPVQAGSSRAPSPLSREAGAAVAQDSAMGTAVAAPGAEEPDSYADADADVDTVDPELRAQVERDAPSFLAKVAEVQNSRAALQSLLDSTMDLQSKAHRLRAKLVAPYQTLRTLQTDLIRLQLGTELLRRAARFESLRWQLDDDLHLIQGERPLARQGGHPIAHPESEARRPITQEERARALARAAFTSSEMTSLLHAPPPASLPAAFQAAFPQLLRSLTPIAAALPFLTSAQDLLRAHLDNDRAPTQSAGLAGAGHVQQAGGAQAQQAALESQRAPVLSFGKRLEEFRQRMGRADTQYVPAHSMYY